MPASPDALAALEEALLAARAAGICIERPSLVQPDLDLPSAYRLAESLARRRERAGEQRLGLKLGFTNRSIWPRYGVYAPVWAPVWSTTLAPLADATQHRVSLAGLVQPRLEPEIVFGFARAPGDDLSLQGLFACLDWVSHGFEIVHTHCADWRFTAPDAVADFGLHGRLLVGPRVPVAQFGSADELHRCLADLECTLLLDGREVDQGRATVVLDGPLLALSQGLQAVRAQTPDWLPEAGHVVTTGTLTDAAPIKPGQNWHTQLTASPRLGLAGLSLQTTG
jgi:2-oxo-3-hexenedioate decarboxylase